MTASADRRALSPAQSDPADTLGDVQTCGDEVARLAKAAGRGALADVCAAHGVDLMVLFGSAAPLLDPDPQPDPPPHDIDIAIRRAPGTARIDQLGLLEDLYRISGSERIDLMLLDAAGPVARQRALTRGRLLYEAAPGLFAEAQIVAALEYLDTAHLRDLTLAAMARP
jgi:hypothetical protein